MGFPFPYNQAWLIGAAGLALASCATPQPTPPQAPCVDYRFEVYFPLGSDQLTTPALQVIAGSASRAKSCRLTGLSLFDLAGESSPDLSARRSAAIIKALTANGVTTPSPDLQGSQEAADFKMLRRRVEVVMHLAPPS